MPLFLPKIEAVGIDLSDRSIKIAQIKKKRNKLILRAISEKEIPFGYVNDGIINKDKENELVEIIKSAFLEFKGSKFTTKKAVCALPEENSFIKVIQVPKIKEEELEEAVKWQIEPNFPVRLKDVFFDYKLINTNEKSNEMSVCVAVVPKDVVFSYLSAFERAGIEPIAFEIESMSVVRAIIGDYSPFPIVILDMGKCGTGFTVFSGNTILFTSHIETGGQILTSAIAKNLKIKEEEAEVLKRKIGLRAFQSRGMTLSKLKFPITNLIGEIKSPKEEKKDETSALFEKVFSAMIPPLTDAAEQIKKYIRYFSDLKEIKDIPTGEVKKIIICGGESRVIGLSEFFTESLKIQVEPANPLSKIEVAKNISSSAFPYHFLSFTCAIGLAIRGANIEYVEF